MGKNNRKQYDQNEVLSSGRTARHEINTSIVSNGTSNDARKYGMRQILVPLDGSPLAEMALPHAIGLARATSSGLLLMRVVPTYTPPISRVGPLGSMGPMYYDPTEIEQMYDEQPALARDYLHGVAERLASMKLQVETVVTEGIPEEMISRHAQEHPDILMIAMSTHGRSGVGRWLFGSVAEKVLQHAAVPVLLVHPDEERGEEILDLAAIQIPLYETVLAPLDGSLSAVQAFDQVQSLVKALSARLVLLSVASSPFDLKLVKRDASADWSAVPRSAPAMQMAEYLDLLSQKLAAEGIDVQAEVTYGDSLDEILKTANFVEADMIVIANHNHDTWGDHTVGRVVMSVAQMATIPLLVVRVEEHEYESSEDGERSATPAQASVIRTGR